MRFFIARGDFNDRELSYLTELDGTNHLAILALRADEPIGVARFIRLERGGRVAEPAFSVIDACHGRGLGRVLADRLAAAARERGIARFEAEVLPQNRAMLRLLCELDGSIPPRGAPSGASITCAVDIVAPASPAHVRQAA